MQQKSFKTAAIIAEYNPLHSGHAYQLRRVRELSGADYIIVLMSGDFVQRGEPAVFNKFVRAEMALLCGADLVLELPCAAASGSARVFAEGAVAILDRLGVVDELWFGSESGDIQDFLKLSDILADEPPAFRSDLLRFQKKGLSWPAAREKALCACSAGPESGLDDVSGPEREPGPDDVLGPEREPGLSDSVCPEPEVSQQAVHDILSRPNNILGLEYCIALRRAGSSIAPCTLPRTSDNYHSIELNPDGSFCSASAIRNALFAMPGKDQKTPPAAATDGNPDMLVDTSSCGIPGGFISSVPEAIRPLFTDTVLSGSIVRADDFSDMLLYQLLRESSDSLQQYAGISPDLANRIMNTRGCFRSFTQYAELLKTRDRTLTSVRRALIHILLGLKKEDEAALADPAYARILGIGNGESLLHAIRRRGSVLLTSRPRNTGSPDAYKKEPFASALYESVRCRNANQPFIHEYSRKMIRIPD